MTVQSLSCSGLFLAYIFWGGNMQVLIPDRDHGYYVAHVRKQKVVWNKKYKVYTEYMGDEYLGEGDEVLELEVAE